MDKAFSQRLANLRKSRKISQKDAAKALGISQALLSHYENGIRECGLDFIVKAADYYKVTCDYLLGRSSSKYGFTDELDFSDEVPEDHVLSTATIYRAASAMREVLGEAVTEDDFSLILYSLCIYRVMVYGVATGKIPAKWININSVEEMDWYVTLIDSLLIRTIEITIKKMSLNMSDKEMPPCVKTVINTAQNAFVHRVDKLRGIMKNRINPEDDIYG